MSVDSLKSQWKERVTKLLTHSSLGVTALCELRLHFADTPLIIEPCSPDCPPWCGCWLAFDLREVVVGQLVREAETSLDPGEALKDLYLCAVESGVEDKNLRGFAEQGLMIAEPSLQHIADLRLRWAATPFSLDSAVERKALVEKLLVEAVSCLPPEVYTHFLLDVIKGSLWGAFQCKGCCRKTDRQLVHSTPGIRLLLTREQEFLGLEQPMIETYDLYQCEGFGFIKAQYLDGALFDHQQYHTLEEAKAEWTYPVGQVPIAEPPIFTRLLNQRQPL